MWTTAPPQSACVRMPMKCIEMRLYLTNCAAVYVCVCLSFSSTKSFGARTCEVTHSYTAVWLFLSVFWWTTNKETNACKCKWMCPTPSSHLIHHIRLENSVWRCGNMSAHSCVSVHFAGGTLYFVCCCVFINYQQWSAVYITCSSCFAQRRIELRTTLQFFAGLCRHRTMFWDEFTGSPDRVSRTRCGQTWSFDFGWKEDTTACMLDSCFAF